MPKSSKTSLRADVVYTSGTRQITRRCSWREGQRTGSVLSCWKGPGATCGCTKGRQVVRRRPRRPSSLPADPCLLGCEAVALYPRPVVPQAIVSQASRSSNQQCPAESKGLQIIGRCRGCFSRQRAKHGSTLFRERLWTVDFSMSSAGHLGQAHTLGDHADVDRVLQPIRKAGYLDVETGRD